MREIAPGQVHVWRIDLRLPAAPSWPGILSPEERTRAAALVRPVLRERFERAHAALRRILSWYLGMEPSEIRIATRERGKPFLPESDLHFNLAHSSDLALLAISGDRELGIDVEAIGPLEVDLVAGQIMTNEETAAFALLTRDLQKLALYRCWTRKEALLKGTGDGASRVREVAVTFGEPAEIVSTRPDSSEKDRWELFDLPIGPGWAAALAVERSTTPVIIECLDAGAA